MLQEITEQTYEEFKKNPKAVLIVSKRDCAVCDVYFSEIKPVVQGKKDVVFATVHYSHIGMQNMKDDWRAFNPAEFVNVPQTFVYENGKIAAQREGNIGRDAFYFLINQYFKRDLTKSPI